MERRRVYLSRLVVVALGCTVASANLVQDGDFSQTIPGDEVNTFSVHWDSSSDGTSTVEPAPDPDPPHFEALFVEGIHHSDQVVSLSQDGLGLQEGVPYIVSFHLSIWNESEVSETDGLWVFLGGDVVYHWTDDDGSVLGETIVRQSTPGAITGLNDILEFKASFDGGPAVEFLPSLNAWRYELTRIAVDDVSVVPVPVPPSVVLAGLGMMSYAVCAGPIARRVRRRSRVDDQLP